MRSASSKRPSRMAWLACTEISEISCAVIIATATKRAKKVCPTLKKRNLLRYSPAIGGERAGNADSGKGCEGSLALRQVRLQPDRHSRLDQGRQRPGHDA